MTSRSRKSRNATRDSQRIAFSKVAASKSNSRPAKPWQGSGHYRLALHRFLRQGLEMLSTPWTAWSGECADPFARLEKQRPTRVRRRLLLAEGLEDRRLLAATSFSDGVLTVDYAVAGEAVSISNDGTNITLVSDASITGAGDTFPTANVNRLVFTDSGNRNDQALVFSPSTPLELAGGISSTGIETVNVYNPVAAIGTSGIEIIAPHNIDVGADITGGGGGVDLQGLGTAVNPNAPVNAPGVYVRFGAVVTATGSGDVSVLGVGGGNNSDGIVGVNISGTGTMITSGGGDVHVSGQGGSGTGRGNFGVWIGSDAVVSSSGTGNVEVVGTAGEGTGNRLIGVRVNGEITSGGGDVIVSGTGGVNATGNSLDGNHGVEVSFLGEISSGGTGSVAVSGVGRSGGGGSIGNGVYLSFGTITSGGAGDVTVTGQSVSGGQRSGVYLEGSGSTITSGGGNVTVFGEGDDSSGTNTYGVWAHLASTISSGGGEVSVTGIGTNGYEAVRLQSDSSIASSNDAAIIITADSLNFTGSPLGSIDSGAGTTTFRPRTAGTRIDLGGADVLSGSPLTLGLTDAELDQITAGTLIIGRNDIASGTVTVSSAIAPATVDTLEVITARDIDVSDDITGGEGGLTLSANQQATPTAQDFVGITVHSGAVVSASGMGAVTVSGAAGTAATSSKIGVYVLGTNSRITSNGGAVEVTGQGGGGSGPFGGNSGVRVDSSGQITSAGDGAVTVQGTGGPGAGNSNNHGVHVLSDGQITSGGNGTVMVAGTGGAAGGNSNYGVFVFGANSLISSGGGNVEVTGFGGGGTGAGSNNRGVVLATAGQISAGADGTVTVLGTGGSSTGSGNVGVHVFGTNSVVNSQITSGGGDVTVNGQGGGSAGSGSGNYGVWVNQSGQIATGGDGITKIQGNDGNGADDFNYGVVLNLVEEPNTLLVHGSSGNSVLLGEGIPPGDWSRAADETIEGVPHRVLNRDEVTVKVADPLRLVTPPTLQTILPLYQYPLSAPAVLSPWWQEVLEAANPETPITVIVNPNSGPIDDSHPAYDNWMEALSQLNTNPHIQFLGYVSTRVSPTSPDVRPTEDILADVATYAEFFRFPNASQSFIDGIFLDEMSNLVGNVGAYQTVADGIRAREDMAGDFLVGNPGTSLPVEYLDQATADLFILREGIPTDLLANPMPGYVTSSDYAHLDFGAIIHGAVGTATLAEMLKEVKLRELDYAFITDDVLPNPFDVAPSYFDVMLRDLRAPYIATTAYSVYEGTVGVSLGTPVSGDPDIAQSLSYSVLSGNDDGNFVIDAATGGISVASSATLDFQTQSQFELLVQVVDNDTSPLSDSAVITINVLEDMQDTDIVLSNDVVAENAVPLENSETIGTLAAVDPTGSQPHTFALYNGVGPNDNVFFTIDGDQLLIQAGTTIDFETKQTYVLHVQATDSQGKTFAQDVLVNVGNRGELELITVGDGTDQRSMVSSLTVIFDTEVTIDPDAFAVNKRGAEGGPVSVNFTTIVDGQGRTVASLTFSGDHTASGSLVDGNYELHIDGGNISDQYGALDLDENGTDGGAHLFGDQATDDFFRLFGDVNGDRDVNFVDFLAFRNSFGSTAGDEDYDERFDFNTDDSVAFQDFLAFRSRFGSGLDFE